MEPPLYGTFSVFKPIVLVLQLYCFVHSHHSH